MQALSKLRVLPEYDTPLTQIHIRDDQSPVASQHCHDVDKHCHYPNESYHSSNYIIMICTRFLRIQHYYTNAK